MQNNPLNFANAAPQNKYGGIYNEIQIFVRKRWRNSKTK